MPRRRSGKKIDFTHWTPASFYFAAVTAGTPQAGTLHVAQHTPETLLRTRGNYATYVDAVQGTGGSALISCGIIMVPEGTGTTVLWSPFGDGDAPWLWVDYCFLGYEEMVTDVVDVPGITSFRSVIDSKAMRIVRNQEMQVVIENQTLGSGVNVNAQVSVRTLAGT